MRNLLVLLLGAIMLICTGPAQAELVVEGDLIGADVGYRANPSFGDLIDPLNPALGFNVAAPFAGSTTWPDPLAPVPGKVTLVGSGSDIWNQADGLHFAYQSFSGDVIITTKVLQYGDPNDDSFFQPYTKIWDPVTGEQAIETDPVTGEPVLDPITGETIPLWNTGLNVWAKAGPMIRAGTPDAWQGLDLNGDPTFPPDGADANAMTVLSNRQGLNNQRRENYSNSTTRDALYQGSRRAPYFVRLTRIGDQYQSSFALPDDVDPSIPGEWTFYPSYAIPGIVDDAYVGVAVTSHDVNLLTRVEFEQTNLEVIPKMTWLGQPMAEGDWDGVGPDFGDPFGEDRFLWTPADDALYYPNSNRISAVIPDSPVAAGEPGAYVVNVVNAQQAFAASVGTNSTLNVGAGGSLTLAVGIDAAAGIVGLGGGGSLTTGAELPIASSILKLNLDGSGTLNAGGPISIASAGDNGANPGVLTITGPDVVTFVASNAGLGSTQINVQDGSLNVAAADPASPTPIYGAFSVVLNNGNLSLFGKPVATDPDQLTHLGYDFNDYYAEGEALQRNLDGNGGLLAVMPTNVVTLTNGPTDEGLDFDNDGQWQASGSTTQGDNYASIFLGNLIVTAQDILDGGNFQFQSTRSDDRVGMWLDVNNNGVFEGSNNWADPDDDHISWEQDNSPKT
ncbi:MAG: hypothetical protein V3R99_11825, partial [Thermoguttaceae bacterium]